MNHQRLLPFLLLFGCLTFSCRKSDHPSPPPPVNCNAFKQSMVSNDIEEVRKYITDFINDLPSSQYTAENMDKLVKSITSHCNVSASILCFDCIKTFPSISEIRISVTASVEKAIDLTYTSNNEMKFVSMHD